LGSGCPWRFLAVRRPCPKPLVLNVSSATRLEIARCAWYSCSCGKGLCRPTNGSKSCPGGRHGLQNRCAAVILSWVGSIPTYSRQNEEPRAGLTARGSSFWGMWHRPSVTGGAAYRFEGRGGLQDRCAERRNGRFSPATLGNVQKGEKRAFRSEK